MSTFDALQVATTADPDHALYDKQKARSYHKQRNDFIRYVSDTINRTDLTDTKSLGNRNAPRKEFEMSVTLEDVVDMTDKFASRMEDEFVEWSVSQRQMIGVIAQKIVESPEIDQIAAMEVVLRRIQQIKPNAEARLNAVAT